MDEVKYSNVHRAIKGLGLEEEWQKVITFRKYLREVKGEIGHVVRIASVINNTRKKFGIPICFPEIVDDSKNIVSFNSLMPFHLLGRPNKSRSANLGFRDLKPIKGLPALNGQIISITGQNGGGKTVVEVELIHALYLAHMGFPVFAEHFTMNAKDTIAMVFVEKGEGSMLQLLMQKLANVAKVVDENPGNKVVVIIDELLTGTQEDAGFSIGKRYLKMLSESNCSTMFVTQITGLAEFARNELGALCFYFDKKGNLQTGIGKGNAEVLAEEVGLSQYLSSN
jgi:DNA mismatch repair ATPase MutS